MNKQNYYRLKYVKNKPSWKGSYDLYRDIIRDFFKQDIHMLDIGCGHSDLLKDLYKNTKNSYGLEPDKKALEKNEFIKNKIVGTVEKMPFEDNIFDIVLLEWVLEHLKYPKVAFNEIYRVLKPGGKVIFLTPNSWNYNVWIIRAIPNRAHSYFTKKFYQRHEGDTYPVRYKINSPKKVSNILRKIGFNKVNVILNGDPTYLSMNDLTFKISLMIEKVLDYKFFNSFKVHLIGVFEKPSID
ncbi:MAG: class I SAM-dependent methyltransferase [Clostridiales bacterium]